MQACPILLPFTSLVKSPFADFLNLSLLPGESGSLLHDLAPLIDAVGAVQVRPGFFPLPGGGSFKLFRRGRVFVFGASGQALDCLRLRGLFDAYLSVFGGIPHRASMLHVAADYAVDAPPYLARLWRRAISGAIALTRKRIARSSVRRYSRFDPEGRSTGTVYLGDRANADVWAKVYDKRNETLDRGVADPGPLVRVELTFQSDVGASLQDVANPAPLFFHYAVPGLVGAAPGVPSWSPHAEGLVLPPPRSLTLSERLKGIITSSSDLDRLFHLSAELGGLHAERDLLHLLRDEYRRHDKAGRLPSL